MRRLATGSRFRHREERSDAAIQSRRLGPSSLNCFACARDDKRAMRDVRIVARVLDDAGAGETGPKLMGREREFGPQALRQRDRNRIGKRPGPKRLERRPRRAAGAGARSSSRA